MQASNTKLIHVACLVIALPRFGQTAQSASCKSVKAANIEAWDSYNVSRICLKKTLIISSILQRTRWMFEQILKMATSHWLDSKAR